MKIVIIHGQSHEGSTCMTARELADKVGGEVREFFLPRDFSQSCLGCFRCFETDLSHCSHYKELEPLVTAILDADLLILASPVYVYHGHRSDDEFSGSFRNLVDDSQTFAGNEQEAGGRNFNCRRRRYEKYHKGYGGQSGNVGHL